MRDAFRKWLDDATRGRPAEDEAFAALQRRREGLRAGRVAFAVLAAGAVIAALVLYRAAPGLGADGDVAIYVKEHGAPEESALLISHSEVHP